MPIPFHDPEEVEALGAAAFLKIEPLGPRDGARPGGQPGAGYIGALFLINARGEPLEFAYNRIETPDTFLWRRADLRRHSHRKLVASLFTVCVRVPRLLLCMANEVSSELFCQDLRLSLPVARLGRPLQAVAHAGVEIEASIDEPEPLHLFWFPAPPAEDSGEQRLFERLLAHGLLVEPFERAVAGLREGEGEAPV